MKRIDSFKIYGLSRMMLSVLFSISFLSVSAQLHEQISVEGRYVPDVIRIDRINTFPKAMKLSLASSPLNYERSGVAAAFNPSPLFMPATSWNASRRISDKPGYLDFGVGSWLNSTLSAGYRIMENDETLLGVRLQHNSTSLWKPWSDIDLKQFRYDESVGVYASQLFEGYGTLDAAIDYHYGHFNYAGFATPLSTSESDQNLNDFAMRFNWRSPSVAGNGISWDAVARMRHFGYRSLWLPDENPLKGSKETNIGFEGGFRMPWDNGSSVGFDGKFDIILLSGGFKGYEEYARLGISNYSLMTLSPYYRFNRGLLDVKLGADIDLAFNAGVKGERYPLLHIAPAAGFAMQTGQVGIYLNLTGGSELNTLSRLHELDYYSMPALLSTRPSFTPLDAALGLNLGPFSGFSLGGEVRYKSTKNIPSGGNYMGWYYSAVSPVEDNGIVHTEFPGGDPTGINIHGLSFSGNIGYEYGRLISLKIKGSVQKQDGETGFFNGYDRPKVIADVDLGVSPVEKLRLNAGFNWRGKRAIYTSMMNDLVDGNGVITPLSGKIASERLPDFTNLSLGASWDFTPDFSINCELFNILNRRNIILPRDPSQGINFAVGLSLRF